MTYAGWTPPYFTVLVNGVDVETLGHGGHQIRGMLIRQNTNGRPDTFRGSMGGFGLSTDAPQNGQSLVVYYATPNRYEFSGIVMRRTMTFKGAGTKGVNYLVEGVGQVWMMARYQPVTAHYENVGINTVVADILARFTDGFRVGAIDSTWGNIDPTDFVMVAVDVAITQLAAAVNAHWYVDEDRCVSFFGVTIPDGNPPSLSNSSWLKNLQYITDLAPARTRDYVVGVGTQTTSFVPAGSTIIPVADVSIFLTPGVSPKVTSGICLAGSNVVSFTAIDSGYGPGSLTGCTGIVSDVVNSGSVATVVQYDDGSAQSALATLLGAGQSGVISHVTIKYRTYDYKNSVYPNGMYARPGKVVSVNITAPDSIVDDFRIQMIDVTVSYHSKAAAVFSRFVTASSYQRVITDILRVTQ